MAEKTKYSVLTRVNHNNKDYEIGKPIDLTDEEAEPLLAVKAIELPSAPAKKDK